MTYDEWAASVPSVIREDSLWQVEAYRLALFLADLAWHDATKLMQDCRTRETGDQLLRAANNISSNIGEGYSRGTGKSRACFYEYALGSARETRDWYYKARHVLEPTVVTHRLELSSRIIRLTLTMASRERRSNRKISTPLKD